MALFAITAVVQRIETPTATACIVTNAKPNMFGASQFMASIARLPIPFRLRVGDDTLSFLSTTTIFGTPTNITLSELAIEPFLQPTSRRRLRSRFVSRCL